MSFTQTGTILKIGDIETVGANNMEKREIVIETGGEYLQQIPFELIKNNVTLPDQFTEGELVTIHFNIRGREWNGRYFSNLVCWKITAGE